MPPQSPPHKPGPPPTFCSVCDQQQFNSPSGITCPNGHGGAPSVEVPSMTIDITPAACKTVEGMQRLAKAQDGLHDALARCAEALRQLVDTIDGSDQPLLATLSKVPLSSQDARDMELSIRGALLAWRDAGQALVDAFRARPEDRPAPQDVQSARDEHRTRQVILAAGYALDDEDVDGTWSGALTLVGIQRRQLKRATDILTRLKAAHRDLSAFGEPLP